ncbi:MAG: hypothetical protein KIT72_02015 [Polyangiaceae bacterium]|nr:hypothetical protein [Polyangiaceae bacterium]MCW5789174.1 hypothetical protein [Polyangiaceae bacterium]
MRRLLASTFFLAWLGVLCLPQQAEAKKEGFNPGACSFGGKRLYGKVKVVDTFPDIRVKVVKTFPDLNVKVVDTFPDSCGRWKMVDTFPDFTVKFVDTFPDVQIRYVDTFPGVP